MERERERDRNKERERERNERKITNIKNEKEDFNVGRRKSLVKTEDGACTHRESEIVPIFIRQTEKIIIHGSLDGILINVIPQ